MARRAASRRGNSAGDGSALPTDRSWFGITLASSERGDIRQSPGGIYIYGDEGRRELPVERGRSTGNAELRELYDALVSNKPIVHDGPWGMATLEVFLAIMQSGRERREVTLTQQCPARD